MDPDLYKKINKRIIFPNEYGGVSIMVAMVDCELTFEEIIEKDVPKGVPYQIIDALEIPTDETYRNAWTYEEV